MLCSLLSALHIEENGGSRSSFTLTKLLRGHRMKAQLRKAHKKTNYGLTGNVSSYSDGSIRKVIVKSLHCCGL